MDVSPELRRVKEQVEADLLAQPGVTGVDIGYKEVGGHPTDVIAIRVLVEEKRDVAPDEAISPEIDGYPTDVIERRFQIHALIADEVDVVLQADTGAYDPLVGGVSIGPCRSPGGRVLAGTLGCVVFDTATGRPMLLSNFHVLAVDNGARPGDVIAQPSRLDGGRCPTAAVGTLARWSLGGSVDGAVAWATQRGVACQVPGVGALNGTAPAAVGTAVRKRGRTTGLTFGTVDTVDLTLTLDYGAGLGNRTLTHQVGVRPNTSSSPRFGGPGDSGSVVVDGANRVVGLYFAGFDGGGYGVANPIGPVLSALGVGLCRTTATPLYRYWNPTVGDHFYTTNWAELNAGRGGFALDGVQCLIHPSPAAGTVALHRYWNPGVTDHFYTIDFNALGMGRFGWIHEGVAGFVYPTASAGTIPLHRYWNPTAGDHFYTTSFDELGPGQRGWSYERVECYVLPPSAGLLSAQVAEVNGEEARPTFRAGRIGRLQASEPDAPETFRVVPTNEETPPVYHLALRHAWEAAVGDGQPYRRSTIDRSLDDEGFIHCSYLDQVQGVADRFYRGRTDVVLLVIDPSKVQAEIRTENLFPHIYGPLPIDAVVRAEPVPCDEDGRLLVSQLLD
jgi:uncharacterized protein (DUF952 family)